VEVEGARMCARVVVEAVHDTGWEHNERSSGKRARAVPQVECELAVEDEERVRVLAMDVRRRAAFARAVVELRDRDLVGFDEHRAGLMFHTAAAWLVGAISQELNLMRELRKGRGFVAASVPPELAFPPACKAPVRATGPVQRIPAGPRVPLTGGW